MSGWLDVFADWCACGFEPDTFWRQTLRLIAAAFKGKGLQFEREHKSRAWHAWHAGYLARWPHDPKYPFPDLSALSGGPRAPVRPQSEAESMAFFKSLAAKP